MQIGKIAFLSGFVLLLAMIDGAASGEDQLPSVKLIMQKAYGDGGICTFIANELRRDEPKWDEIALKSKDLLPLAEELRANPSPKGDREDWERRTQVYLDSAQKLDEAIQMRDKSAALAAQAKMIDCKSCHLAHRMP